MCSAGPERVKRNDLLHQWEASAATLILQRGEKVAIQRKMDSRKQEGEKGRMKKKKKSSPWEINGLHLPSVRDRRAMQLLLDP